MSQNCIMYDEYIPQHDRWITNTIIVDACVAESEHNRLQQTDFVRNISPILPYNKPRPTCIDPPIYYGYGSFDPYYPGGCTDPKYNR